MKRNFKLIALAVAALMLAYSAMDHVSSKERESFAQHNTEREIAGLEPYTWDEYRKHKPKGDTDD